MNQHITPYQTQSTKKEQVAEMFDSISPKYDLLNHVLSGGIDILWRKKAIRQLKSYARKGGEAFEAVDLRVCMSSALSMMEPQLKIRG